MITCTAYGPAGPAVFLATTEDFRSVERHGIVRHPEDKNAALLPHRIDGRWVLLHRPKTQFGGAHGEILLSRSDDLVSWSTPEQVLQPRDGAWWDSLRIGIGPPPLRTEHGWLLVYHGVKETVGGDIYRVGLALLDLDEPTRVLRRLPGWILAPLAPYERSGDVPNVVFPCGLLHDAASDELRLYYGAADSSICLASARLARPPRRRARRAARRLNLREGPAPARVQGRSHDRAVEAQVVVDHAAGVEAAARPTGAPLACPASRTPRLRRPPPRARRPGSRSRRGGRSRASTLARARSPAYRTPSPRRR